jgi:hypothetical protein
MCFPLLSIVDPNPFAQLASWDFSGSDIDSVGSRYYQ